MPYVTLDELKLFLDERTSEYDAELRVALAAAEAMCDQYMNRSLALATVTEQPLGTGSTPIYPRRTPITGVTSCTVDGNDVPVTFNALWVRRKDGAYWLPTQNIVLTYTGGLAVIPEDVKTAVKIAAQAARDAPDFDANAVSESGAVNLSYQPGGPGSIPRASQTILSPYKRVHPG